jgi:hypothetical protein
MPSSVDSKSSMGIHSDGYCENGPFAEERVGWKGYVEWEKYPEKKAAAAKILAEHTFPPVCPN